MNRWYESAGLNATDGSQIIRLYHANHFFQPAYFITSEKLGKDAPAIALISLNHNPNT
jgi:hypothetical protein